MRASQAGIGVRAMAPLLGVSRSGCYAWRDRGASARAQADERLKVVIAAAHAASRGTYGTPRIRAELAERGLRTSRKRVARLMRALEVCGVSRRRRVRTTIRNAQAQPAPDLVDRNFVAKALDQLWVADITYVPTVARMLHLAVVPDACSRRVVGWAMAVHLRATLVLDALEMALEQRRPQAVIHHSDQGCQYTSLAFGHRCRIAGVRPSMGSVGDCYDNAMAESFFATLECELLGRSRFPNPPARRSSSSSRAGTTPTGDTPPSATCRPRTSNNNSRGRHEPAFRPFLLVR